MILILITNDSAVAGYAISSGVDRILIDLEVRGKEERQGHLDTHRSSHVIADVSRLRRKLPAEKIMVRVNPIDSHSVTEIDKVIEGGAAQVMLPMFTSDHEVEEFLGIVNGRARTTLLLETPQALVRIDEILTHWERIDEVHIGLNDLHLGMGLDFMFELLAGGIVDYAAEKIIERGIRLGIGGIARVGEGDVPAELVIGEHVRIGSEMAILSRSFHDQSENLEDLLRMDLPGEIEKVRSCHSAFENEAAAVLNANHVRLQDAVRRVVRKSRFSGKNGGRA